MKKLKRMTQLSGFLKMDIGEYYNVEKTETTNTQCFITHCYQNPYKLTINSFVDKNGNDAPETLGHIVLGNLKIVKVKKENPTN